MTRSHVDAHSLPPPSRRGTWPPPGRRTKPASSGPSLMPPGPMLLSSDRSPPRSRPLKTPPRPVAPSMLLLLLRLLLRQPLRTSSLHRPSCRRQNHRRLRHRPLHPCPPLLSPPRRPAPCVVGITMPPFKRRSRPSLRHLCPERGRCGVHVFRITLQKQRSHSSRPSSSQAPPVPPSPRQSRLFRPSNAQGTVPTRNRSSRTLPSPYSIPRPPTPRAGTAAPTHNGRAVGPASSKAPQRALPFPVCPTEDPLLPCLCPTPAPPFIQPDPNVHGPLRPRPGSVVPPPCLH